MPTSDATPPSRAAAAPMLADRIAAEVPATTRSQLGPIELAILMAVIGSVVAHLIDDCWERLRHRSHRQCPGPLARGQLWLWCHLAARTQQADRPHYLAGLAYDAVLAAGRAATEPEVAALIGPTGE